MSVPNTLRPNNGLVIYSTSEVLYILAVRYPVYTMIIHLRYIVTFSTIIYRKRVSQLHVYGEVFGICVTANRYDVYGFHLNKWHRSTQTAVSAVGYTLVLSPMATGPLAIRPLPRKDGRSGKAKTDTQ